MGPASSTVKHPGCAAVDLPVPHQVIRPEPARPEDAREVAALFAQVFADDPVWSAIVPNRALRRAVIRRSFLSAFARGDAFDVVRGEDGSILGALHFSAPAGPPEDASFPGGPVGRALQRLPWVKRGAAHDAQVHSHRPDGAHWYFQDIVVSPAARGQGLGSTLLSHRLAQVDADPLPVFLESTTPASRRLYERLGFAQVGEVNALPNGTAYAMVRPS